MIDHKVAEYWKEHYDLNARVAAGLVYAGAEVAGEDSSVCGERLHLIFE